MLRLMTAASSLVLLTFPAIASSVDYNVGPFTSIKAYNGVVVRVVAGDEQRVTASAGNPAALAKLRVTVEQGNLVVGFDPGFRGFDFLGGNVITVDVEMPTLIDSDLAALPATPGTEVSSPTLHIDAAMGATLFIEGTCGSASVSVNMGATVDAKALECEVVTVNATMGGMTGIFARDKAVIDASSGASVDVYGNPADYTAEDHLGAVIHRIN
jgi:hypothetical protein